MTQLLWACIHSCPNRLTIRFNNTCKMNRESSLTKPAYTATQIERSNCSAAYCDRGVCGFISIWFSDSLFMMVHHWLISPLNEMELKTTEAADLLGIALRIDGWNKTAPRERELDKIAAYRYLAGKGCVSSTPMGTGCGFAGPARRGGWPQLWQSPP